MSLVYRSEKGSELEWDELDGNFLFLENQVAGGDRFLAFTGFSLSGQDLTLNSASSWRINMVLYSNTSAVVINIPFAASGMERIDLIVATTSNTFVRISGTESASNPVAPPIPSNTIQATFISVTDGSVGAGTPPIVGSEFVKKSEFAENIITDSGDVTLLLDNESTAYRFTGAVTSLKGFDVTSLFTDSNSYVGKEIKVANNSGTDFPIKHNSGTVNVPIRFPKEVDFIFKNNEVITLALAKTDILFAEYKSIGRDDFGGTSTISDLIRIQNANYCATENKWNGCRLSTNDYQSMNLISVTLSGSPLDAADIRGFSVIKDNVKLKSFMVKCLIETSAITQGLEFLVFRKNRVNGGVYSGYETLVSQQFNTNLVAGIFYNFNLTINTHTVMDRSTEIFFFIKKITGGGSSGTIRQVDVIREFESV